MIYTPVISRYAGETLSAGTGWTGVARVHDGVISGSAVLLSSGIFLLTAAHVTDDLAVADAEVEFAINGSTFTRTVMSVERYPFTFINSLGVWHDLALITLTQAAPVAAERYDLYSGESETGAVATLVGYGRLQGSNGVVLSESNHTRRWGENTVDTVGTGLPPFWLRGSLSAQLFYDYDDGTTAHDALGQWLGTPDLGLGSREAMITAGDSGGGLFIEENGRYRLAGVNSFVTRSGQADTTADADGSVGDIGAATRVSSYTEWIETQTSLRQTPTPQSGTVPVTDQVPKQVNEGEGVWFLAQLTSGPAVQITSVDFFTRDGTARAGEDYISTQGTLTLAPGERWVKLWVQTLADNIVEGNEVFSMVLVNPQGAIFPDGVAELTASRTIIDDVTLVGVTQMTPELFA